MKKFLKKFSFFLTIIVVGILALELFYRFIPNNYIEKNKQIRENYDSEVVFFGNSHTFYGMNPDFFSQKAYNLSNVSQTIQYDKLLFDKHFDSLKNLKCITINVEYSTLSQNDYMPELQWRKYFYESQMDLKTGMVSNFDIRKYVLCMAPRFKLTVSSIRECFNKGSLVECLPNGWAPKEGVNNQYNNPDTGKAIARKHEDGSVDFSKNSNRLQGIITKCKERGIKVVLVTMPVTSYYAENVNKEKLNLIFTEANKLAQNNYNAYYINLFNDDRFNNDDFYDSDHLNTIGAKRCSEIVNGFIESMP
ncbi:hypothetical protein [Flavobacterium alkalisoli]|uniref:hypothetical protein n=1 Tax=Flavobacterium alkalisoli TaxID=2602769 RepID=UPI003A92B04F